MSIADEEHAQNFLVDLREKLQRVHRRLQEAMEELVERKNYADAEEQLRAVDQAMLDLIQRLGGVVVRDRLQ